MVRKYMSYTLYACNSKRWYPINDNGCENNNEGELLMTVLHVHKLCLMTIEVYLVEQSPLKECIKTWGNDWCTDRLMTTDDDMRRMRWIRWIVTEAGDDCIGRWRDGWIVLRKHPIPQTKYSILSRDANADGLFINLWIHFQEKLVDFVMQPFTVEPIFVLNSVIERKECKIL